ncbi:MFS transporter [Paenibacillus sp. GCM10012307]|uniref:MFS transporter n=1 Tax=Paenibacillus roseus TaxID=2798579 RepID=A0A934J4M1_9BACL|nr:MFS transporter [Paenibacillus roseus]MBJ6363194.1 MFS transporter [Paenibacillus roseus]
MIKGKHYEKFLIITIGISVFAGVMSTSMITIAFPDLVFDFKIDYSTLQIRNILFFSFFAAGLPLFGSIADRVGPKKLVQFGLTLFILSNIVSGFSINWAIFLVAQSLQAISDSMIVPALVLLIRQSFKDEKIGWAFGWFSATLASATLIGPALGGGIVEYTSWRYIFLALTLFSLVSLMLGTLILPKDGKRNRNKQIPFMNTVSLVLFLCFFQFSLVASSSIFLTVSLVVALLSLSMLLFLETRNKVNKIFPAGAFNNKIFVVSLIRVFLLFLVSNAMILIIPSLMRDHFGLSPDVIGLIIIIESIIAISLAGFAGKLADLNALKTMTFGFIPILSGLVLLQLTSNININPIILFVLFFLCIGLGSTFASPALNKIAMLSVPKEETGSYMGLFQMIQFGTGAFASGIIGLLVSGGTSTLEIRELRSVFGVAIFLIISAVLTTMVDKRFLKIQKS